MDLGIPPPSTQSLLGVYDAERERTIALHGQAMGGMIGTWELNGAGWQQVATPIAPPTQSVTLAGGFAFDRRRDVGVYCTSGELWTYDGAAWTQRVAWQPSSLAHGGLAAAYDELRDKVVFFGGTPLGGSPVNSTWEWNGAELVERFPENSPPARRLHSMTYDPIRQRVIMFGGQAGSQFFNDLWEFDGQNWTQVNETQPWPSARFGARMAADRRRGKVVLYGGDLEGSDNTPDFWEWDGAGWQERSIGNGAMSIAVHGLLVFDERAGQVTIVAEGATWSLAAPPLPAVTGPQSVTVQPGQGAALSVTSNDSRALTYQWRRNGQLIPGQTFSALLFVSPSESAQGVYDCIVGLADQPNGCVEVIAGPALLTVAPACPQDLDGDGTVNFADLNLVLGVFNTGCQP
ncbi:MAG: hypothetical protein IBJ10_11175 [Phycisphaerales bacterium]|nr:hypothetical protein [Phycisphaerales bacterium]